MTDAIAALLLQALEAQCEESGGGLVMVRSDDLTSVEIEGSFDLRTVAAMLGQALPAPCGAPDPEPVISIPWTDDQGRPVKITITRSEPC